MPSKTKKQAKFMAAVANNPKFARKAGVPQSVGREFANADKRNKDMPSKYNSTANKPGKAVKKGYARGGMAHDKRVLRNLDDEVYRIAPKERMGGAEGRDARDERRRINREKAYEKRHMAKGGKAQGYDARQDESIGARNKTKGQQNLKSRRDEAQAMEKHGGKRKYADVSTMDKGRRKKFAKGGKAQGYDARLDESLGARNKTKGKQSLKSRRSESEGMEKAMGRRKYQAVGTMDKSGKKRSTKRKANNQATSPLTPQHKRMAMGENVVKKYVKGGKIDGIAKRGKTKGRFV